MGCKKHPYSYCVKLYVFVRRFRLFEQRRKNRPIIKVDDIIVYQDEIRNQYNQELQAAKNLFGDNIDVNDNMKTPF